MFRIYWPTREHIYITMHGYKPMRYFCKAMSNWDPTLTDERRTFLTECPGTTPEKQLDRNCSLDFEYTLYNHTRVDKYHLPPLCYDV